jgi:hypothetical protein
MWNQIQGLDDQKLSNFYFTVKKTALYLSLGFHEGRSSYRRSLQPSKENIKQLKSWSKEKIPLLKT